MILKTIFLYFFIILSYRVMGKKEVGKLGIIDLIVSVLIAELAAMSIEDNKNLLVSVVPIVVLVVIQVSLSYITLKSIKLRQIIDGNPTIIIKNGQLNFKEMTKLRYSLDDLLIQLRGQGIKSIEEVEYAVLENNGKLSVFNKKSNYPLPIIVDGIINHQALKDLKKDYKWLNNILKTKNLKLEDIFYAFQTDKKTFIIKKEDLL